jgi:hypothetical protein
VHLFRNATSESCECHVWHEKVNNVTDQLPVVVICISMNVLMEMFLSRLYIIFLRLCYTVIMGLLQYPPDLFVIAVIKYDMGQ